MDTFWDPLGSSFEPLGALLGHFGTLLGLLWDLLGPSWGPLGPSWVSLGSLFASLGLSVHYLQPQGLIFNGFRLQKAMFSLQRVLKNDAPTIEGASFSEN